MNKVFCFFCKDFVEILSDRTLECGHRMIDQQSIYEFIIEKIEQMIIDAANEFKFNLKDAERRQLALKIAIDFLAELYTKEFFKRN